jgi:lipopolysaccharide/colanic/teichoic acid biosynthesis glycosyltransferase
LAADLLWITAACILVHLLRYGSGAHQLSVEQPVPFYLLSLTTALGLWTLLYFNQSLEGFSTGWHLPTMFSRLIVAVFYLIGCLLAFGYLAKYEYSRLGLLILALLLPVGFSAIRCLAWWWVKTSARVAAVRRVVILGSGRLAQELASKIARHPEMRIEVAGFLYPSDLGPSNGVPNSKAGAASVRTLQALDLLQEKKVQELIVADSLPAGSEIEKLIISCHQAGMQVHLVPQHYELYLSKARLTEIDDVPLISVEARDLPPAALELKRVVDLVCGFVLLAMFSPLIGLMALALHWRKGTAFDKEIRSGRNGRPFLMHRLNVDRDAPDLVGLQQFLVKFSLTELPQLWNVLRGEMSLVGPRPESPERVKHYSVWQRQRLSIKPGLTGLAQVHGLREQHSSEEKAHFDLQYIYHCSLFFDFSILLQTAWTLVFRLFESERRGLKSMSKQTRRSSFTIREALHADSSQSDAD